MSTPPRVPAMGMVAIHEMTRRPTRWKLTALRVPLQRPTPTVAPVMHIEVETGREYCEKRRTVMAAPISIEEPKKKEESADAVVARRKGDEPLLGEWYVILFPITIQ
jgi:hypothetical protein